MTSGVFPGRERWLMGVDLGGTDIKAGIVGDDYALRDQLTAPTPKGRGEDKTVQKICECIRTLLARNGLSVRDVRGIGIACPGIIDAKNGTVVYSNNFSWQDVPLLSLLAGSLSAPLYIRNDAECAGIAEWKAGGGRGCDDLVFLTLGTGVGSCVIANGRPVEGVGSGGICGHMIIHQNGRLCTCGKRGCLEAYASGAALANDAGERLKARRSGPLYALCGGDIQKIDAKMVFAAAREGDAAALGALDAYTDALALGIGNLIDIFRPRKVLLGGGVSRAGEQLLQPLRKKIPAYCYAGDRLAIPPVEAARLGAGAGIVGAAALVREDA
jgi:glucokinase